MNNIKKLKEIFDGYDKAINQVSKEIVAELKIDSKTYEEADRKMNLFEKEIVYNNLNSQNHKYLLIYLIAYVKELLEKEKNDLPLTNRSE